LGLRGFERWFWGFGKALEVVGFELERFLVRSRVAVGGWG
jgi:hypothetical protein